MHLPAQKPVLLVVCGATAVGKTAAAIQLAQELKTEIISADSRQFFKEMSIGTAKPTTQELAAVPHHFVGHLSVHDFYTPGDFERDVLKLLNRLFAQHSVVIMVGGSGLYIQAVCRGIDVIPDIDLNIRSFLNKKFEYHGLAPLLEQLKWLDPNYYFRVDRNNPQRVIRALEVCLGTGKPFSSFHTNAKQERPFKIIKIEVSLPREVLYAQINMRVDTMISHGLETEARLLWPYKHINALQTVGYTEFFDYFEGKIDYKTTIELIKQHTRHYAKRQITWFRRESEINRCSPEECLSMAKLLLKNT